MNEENLLKISKEKYNTDKNIFWRYIKSGFPPKLFIDHLNCKSILDIGCGDGEFLIECIDDGFTIADGVEIDVDLVNQYKYDPLYNITIWNQDIFNFKPKKEYDLIYMFDPMKDFEFKIKLLNYIHNIFPNEQLIYYINVGSYLIYHFFSDISNSKDKYYNENDEDNYKYYLCYENNIHIKFKLINIKGYDYLQIIK